MSYSQYNTSQMQQPQPMGMRVCPTDCPPTGQPFQWSAYMPQYNQQPYYEESSGLSILTVVIVLLIMTCCVLLLVTGWYKHLWSALKSIFGLVSPVVQGAAQGAVSGAGS